MSTKPLPPQKPTTASIQTAAPKRALAVKTVAVHRVTERAEPGAAKASGRPGAYLPLPSDSKTARSHRVLAPTLKPTRVSEEDIAEAVRSFSRS